MGESLDDLLNCLIERIEPGQTLLENAYNMLYIFTGDEQIVAHLLDVLSVRWASASFSKAFIHFTAPQESSIIDSAH